MNAKKIFSEWPAEQRMHLLVALDWLGAKSRGYHAKNERIFGTDGGGLNVCMPERADGTGRYMAVIALMNGAGFQTDHSHMDDPATGNRVLQFTLKDPEPEIIYKNYYSCDCGGNFEPAEWSGEWSAQCNDKCPNCGREVQPFDSKEI